MTSLETKDREIECLKKVFRETLEDLSRQKHITEVYKYLTKQQEEELICYRIMNAN